MKRKRIIIAIIVVIVILVAYVGGYFIAQSKNKEEIEHQKEMIEKIDVVDQDEVSNEKTANDDSKDNIQKTVEVQLNETTTKDFMILSETDNTYILISLESVGNLFFLDENKEALPNVLNSLFPDWNNVGMMRLPTYEEITLLKPQANVFLDTEYNPEENLVNVYDGLTGQSRSEPVGQNYDVYLVIEVVKAFVKTK